MEQKEMKKVVYKLPMMIIPALAFVALIGVLIRLFRLRADGWMYIVAIVVAIVITFGLEVIALLASKAMEKDDEVIEKKMAFNKWLTMEIQNLEGRMSAGAARDAVHALYEDARFSDPMSNGETQEKECAIAELVVTLTEAIKDKDEKKTAEVADEIKLLIAERNRICKASK